MRAVGESRQLLTDRTLCAVDVTHGGSFGQLRDRGDSAVSQATNDPQQQAKTRGLRKAVERTPEGDRIVAIDIHRRHAASGATA